MLHAINEGIPSGGIWVNVQYWNPKWVSCHKWILWVHVYLWGKHILYNDCVYQIDFNKELIQQNEWKLGCCGKWGKWTNLSWICPTMNSSKQPSIQESESQFERVYLSVDPTWWIFFSCTNAMENSTASNIWMMSTSPECWLQGGRQQRLQFCLNDLGTKFANSFFLLFEIPPVLDAFTSVAVNFTGRRLWFLISADSGAWSIAAEFQFLFTFVSGRYKEVYIEDLPHERGNFSFVIAERKNIYHSQNFKWW
jgi:hypothetical protein